MPKHPTESAAHRSDLDDTALPPRVADFLPPARAECEEGELEIPDESKRCARIGWGPRGSRRLGWGPRHRGSHAGPNGLRRRPLPTPARLRRRPLPSADLLRPSRTFADLRRGIGRGRRRPAEEVGASRRRPAKAVGGRRKCEAKSNQGLSGLVFGLWAYFLPHWSTLIRDHPHPHTFSRAMVPLTYLRYADSSARCPHPSPVAEQEPVRASRLPASAAPSAVSRKALVNAAASPHCHKHGACVGPMKHWRGTSGVPARVLEKSRKRGPPACGRPPLGHPLRSSSYRNPPTLTPTPAGRLQARHHVALQLRELRLEALVGPSERLHLRLPEVSANLGSAVLLHGLGMLRLSFQGPEKERTASERRRRGRPRRRHQEAGRLPLLSSIACMRAGSGSYPQAGDFWHANGC